MRQLRQQLQRDAKEGPREVPSSPDGAARALAGIDEPAAYVLACRECGGPLLADGDGGWSCPRRDQHESRLHSFVASYGNRDYCAVCGELRVAARHVVHGKTCPKKPHSNPSGGYLHGEDDDAPYDVDGWRYCGRCHRVL